MLSCEMAGDTLVIKGELQVHSADLLAEHLDKAGEASQTLRLDLSGVTDVDLAGLQLLLALARSRPAPGALVLCGIKPHLLKALELTGLHGHLAAFLE